MASCIVAITGASGAVYGMKLIVELVKRGDDVELIISPSGFLLLREELGLRCTGKDIVTAIMAHVTKRTTSKARAKKEVKKLGTITYLPHNDLTRSVASGSALKKVMVICPCSMGTLARVSSGVSGNLIERAADCVIKERGELVLVPRETPLSPIHLENMLKLSRIGVTILPAMPAFYFNPTSIDEMVDFVVGKILDTLGKENNLYRRWRAKEE